MCPAGVCSGKGFILLKWEALDINICYSELVFAVFGILTNLFGKKGQRVLVLSAELHKRIVLEAADAARYDKSAKLWHIL
jgi:hypothetical protein